LPLPTLVAEMTMSYLSELRAEFDVRFTAGQRRWVLLPLLLAFPLAVLLGQWVGSLTASNVPPVAFPLLWLASLAFVIERKA